MTTKPTTHGPLHVGPSFPNGIYNEHGRHIASVKGDAQVARRLVNCWNAFMGTQPEDYTSDQNRKLEADLMRSALRKAADQFEAYAQHHADKGDAAKERRNREMAGMCRAAADYEGGL